MQCKIVHFLKNGFWWDPWNAGVPLVPQLVISCFCKSFLQKKDQQRFIYCEQPK